MHFLKFAQNFKKMHQQIKKSNNFTIKLVLSLHKHLVNILKSFVRLK